MMMQTRSLSGLNEKLNRLRAEVRRSPGPAEAEDNIHDLRVVWVAKPDACGECKTLADGSPYRRGRLKSWPGLTSCGSSCRCYITAAQPDWDATFNARVGSEERGPKL